MKHFIFLILFTISNVSYSQTEVGLNAEEFLELKKDFGEMTKSDDYMAMKANTKEMTSKFNKLTEFEKLKSEDEWIEFISEHISETKFSSIQEAVTLRKRGFELIEKNLKDYKDVWERFKKASRKQAIEILEAERKGEFN